LKRAPLALFALAMCASADAQQGGLEPGEYITERGWGVLKIDPAVKSALPFSIEAVGGNLFVCALEGDIRNGRATLESEDRRKPCVVTFTRKGDAIDVTSNDMCGYHCGAHASFPGVYYKVATLCTTVALKKSREGFKTHYDRKDYTGARALLEPVVKNCARTLDRFTGGWIRNDLAITQYRLGDRAGCGETLRPLANDAAKTNEALIAEYGAMDAERYLPVVRAARTNLKLCRGAK
jgi:hypothetical protein